MKFIIPSVKLLKSLQALSGLVGNNNTLPILEDFKFDLQGENLKITASDLETTMTVTMQPEKAEGNGCVTIPARMMIDTLKYLPDVPVTFIVDEESLFVEIHAGEGHFKLAGHNGDEFPKHANIVSDVQWLVPADVMAAGFEKTVFATGNDELRPVMSGVFVEMGENGLTFVATDAHRLVRYIRHDVKMPGQSSFIMPRKAITQMKSALASLGDEPVDISFDNTNVVYKFGAYELYCRLIEGRYVNYTQVIPRNNPNELVIDRQQFSSAIRRVSVFSNKATKQVRFRIMGQSIVLSADDVDTSSEAKERLVCEYKGDDIEIGFNARFLDEMLSNLDSQEVKLAMSAPNKASLLMPYNTENSATEDVLMLLMPVMLG